MSDQTNIRAGYVITDLEEDWLASFGDTIISDPSDPLDDYDSGISTTGVITVGQSSSGEIEVDGDIDWFATELEAGTSYQIGLKGIDSDSGTLEYPYLDGIYDEGGLYISGTGNDDGGMGMTHS